VKTHARPADKANALTEQVSAQCKEKRGFRFVAASGLALLLAIAATGWFAWLPSEVPQRVAATSGQSSHNGFYLRNRMWLADAKTFAHMLSYVLSPELPANTNQVVKG
jgi:hypothetical protein